MVGEFRCYCFSRLRRGRWFPVLGSCAVVGVFQVSDIKGVGVCTPAEQSACLVLQVMSLLGLMLVMTVWFPPCCCLTPHKPTFHLNCVWSRFLRGQRLNLFSLRVVFHTQGMSCCMSSWMNSSLCFLSGGVMDLQSSPCWRVVLLFLLSKAFSLQSSHN